MKLKTKYLIAVSICLLFCIVGICILTGNTGATLLTMGAAGLVLIGIIAIPID